MAKLIIQCCVCGVVYDEKTCKGDKEKVSHGYCPECHKNVMAELAVLKTKMQVAQ